MVNKNKPISILMLIGALTLPANASTDLVLTKQAVAISQQNGRFSGVVSDSFGPVTGATVLVKGTSNGVITDLDGKFSLENLKNGDIVQFSFIGYKTLEVKYTGQADVALMMVEDTEMLDEVVVTALGMKRSQKALGYAVTELKGDELSKTAINPISALQGKVAGVQISGSDGGMFGSNKIEIRGASTLSGNNQPIYVVDGVILANETSGKGVDWDTDAGDFGNMLKNLNPDDFETISVLKGAAATALYGSRGLNGAVVITTKSGAGAAGFGISVTQSVGFDHARGGMDRQMDYGQGTLAGGISYGETNAEGGYNKWDTNQFRLNSAGIPTIIEHTSLGWGPRYDGRAIEDFDGRTTSYSPIESNMADVYQLGVNSNTNVAIRGGNETTNYYSSFSYKKAKGIIENNDFERYSLLLKGSHKISEWVDINASVSFANSTPENALRSVGEGFATGRLTTMYDTKYYRDKYLGEHGGLASATYGDKYANAPGTGKNLWFAIDNKNSTRVETVVRPTVAVNVKLTDWAKFRAEGNMNYYYISAENKELGGGYANEGGYYSMSEETRKQTTFAGSFFFDKKLPKDFHIGGFVRGEYYTTRNSSLSSNTEGGLIVPGQYFLANSKNPAKIEGKINNTKRMLSAVAAINLSWKSQVYLDITGRNDWSSSLVYTNATGNYSYFYPSIGGSWLINETLELPEWISFAKLRASWAQVGNDASPYSIYSGYSVGTMEQANGNIYTNGVPDKLYSADLKPERKTSWEIGLDWRFIKNRISLDATYYKENTVDQIMTIAIPSISGIKNQLVNAGNIQNSGVEISLNTIPFRNDDWEWNLDFTYTRNRSKIVELHPNVANSIGLAGDPGGGDFSVGSVAKKGAEYGMVYSTAMPKVNEQGQTILKWDETYRTPVAVRSGESVEVGSMMPDFLGSMSTGVTYKNISLYVGLDARVGGIVASYSNRYGTAYGWTEESLAYRDAENGGAAWTSNYADTQGMQFNDGVIPEGVFASGTKVTGVDGKTHDVGGQSFADLVAKGVLEPAHASGYTYRSNDWGNGTVNDGWVNELSYLALREVTVGYQLPKSFAAKLGAQGLNISFSGRNLGYLYNSMPNNLNPEGIRGNNTAEFRERSNSPYTASYVMTLNLNF